MSEHVLPETGATIELTVTSETVPGVRVVATEPGAITLSLALAAVPPAGANVTLRWPAGIRGRYALPVHVEEVDENRIRVRPIGRAEIQQQRNFVRGGGGERVMLRRPRCPDVYGWIRDISEQGIRAHFEDVILAENEEIKVVVELEQEVVELAAVTSRVASLRQTVPVRGPMSVEVVAALLPDEHQAQLIRRYVMRQQVLNRARTAG
ncbi:hypothetical protein [Actinoplanes sp. NBRC 103695]|uniref:hypothetical protein n=1 Tax=Actinoplanes sp. NBRC 103695 TaxID=3032202 RepID=UPI0024A147F9|nr:hypothetical protein [Actinoplanes sp. NBRC 103695]GLY96470.1 hypothetical protein Acsp02_37250 [Actinoplanes sp. NBRC 103695]